MIRKSALAAGAAVTVLALSACGQQATSSTSSEDISVVFSNIAETTTLDPAIAYSSDGFEFVRNVYEGLTMYEPGGVEPVGDIAESWEMSDDATEYTFSLRDGLTFHDGSELTSEDVVASIERVQGVNQGPATLLSSVTGVTAPDDLTVVIALSAADVFLPGKLQKIAIVSADAIEENKTADDEWAEDWFAENEAGSGAYEFDSWAKGSAIELTAFEDYYLPWQDGTPTKVTLRVDADVQTALQLMGQGEIDMLGAVGPDDSASAAGIDGVKLVEQSGFSVQVLPLNTQKGALADVRVREAVSLAFDYQAMLDYYQGYGELSVGPLPTGFGNGIEDLPAPTQDIEAAKALLAEAGYADGLTLTYLGLSGLSYEEFTGTLLQQNLAAIGIDLEIQMVPWAQMSSIQSNPETAEDISFLNMSAVTSDPSTMLASGYISSNIASNGGYNWSYYQDPAVDAAVAALPGIADADERAAAVLDTVEIINNQYVSIYVAQPSLAQPVLEKWNVTYEVMDYNYVVRFFYATAS
jgi:peptide/nickel transport system substrate-binding protein